ncbi:hypothetical protein SKAU_G00416250 [Synaphobranchus kaupii]|uniref:Integrase catalytic domain-containing protein n=1 Tax=Synaphobranchus kaupii TaxID=118154 RepID=A0A9Q1IBI2_SYNKA|nr:hypothetical protein SKAU_G00416250 [Synaphobranchus kaupii]
MKSLALSYVWWPGIDSQIELQAKSCHSCQWVQKEPGLAPLHPWMWPSSPWERIHVDFAGPFEGHMYLVVVDAHSKWPESNGVKYIRSVPYHPATNGLAERFVQTFKHALKSSRGTAPVQQRLDTFMLTYRNTPHATTKEPPAMFFLRRKLRSRLDFLKPSVAGTVHQSQDSQQQHRQLHSKARQFVVGEPVTIGRARKSGHKVL